MSGIAARLIFPYARAYARHAGLGLGDEALRAEVYGRAAQMPRGPLLLAALGALAMRWVMPLLFLRTPRSFDALTKDQADTLLMKLQFTARLFFRGPFMAVKAVVLPACYGGESRMADIGYRTEAP